MATESLKNILADINTQKMVLPQFQRDFVWSPSAIIKLLTSLFSGYPIGSLLLMENNDRYDYRAIDGVVGERKSSDGETILVLDGQQRLTACWRAFFGTLDTDKKHAGRYYFDYRQYVKLVSDDVEIDTSALEDLFVWYKPLKVKAKMQTTAHEISEGLFPLDVLFGQPRGSNYADWLQKYNFNVSKGIPDDFERLSGISSRFQTKYVEKVTGYQVNHEKILRDTDADVICTVFETINTTGVKLTVFDLLVAKCYKSDIRLRDKLEDAVANYVNIAFFDPTGTSIAAIQLPRIIGLLYNGQCKKSDLLNLPVKAIRDHWDSAVTALDRALALLRLEFGCAKEEFIPSMDIISPLSVLISDIRYNKSVHFPVLAKLYWNLVFSLYLSGAPESKSAKIVRDWKEVLYEKTIDAHADALKGFVLLQDDMREATRASAIYKGVISLLIANGACDFGPMRRSLKISGATIEDHHIFPQQFLRNSDIKGYLANGILNRTPIYADTNRSISSTAPEIYFSEKKYVGEQPISQTYLDRHAISLDLVLQPFNLDAFTTFCNDRQIRILAMIEKVTGRKPVVDDLASN